MTLSHRPHLRDDVQMVLMDRIVAGRLSAGKSVGEEVLAAELGISRTPLREALIALERDGFVTAIHSRGFVVTPLTEQEIRELYPILWSLETAAVELMAEHRQWNVPALQRIAARFATATSPRARLKLDTEWHTALITPCSNARLLSIAARVRLGVRRYELAYMGSLSNRGISTTEHEGIANELARNEPGAAIALLKQHWQDGQARVLDMIHAHQSGT